jgi:UDP-N-acetyl-D-galactosamine dehydrogenase
LTDQALDKIAVLGLGYVGLPLALAFARAGFVTTGFDTNSAHIRALNAGTDPNGEVAEASLHGSTARFSSDPGDLEGATAFVIAVPTPVTDAKSRIWSLCSAPAV